MLTKSAMPEGELAIARSHDSRSRVADEGGSHFETSGSNVTMGQLLDKR
jgi:hypothetical protein